MSMVSDVCFWDWTLWKYVAAVIVDQAGYERTLDRIRVFLELGDRVLELGCGTGTMVLRLAGVVQSYLAMDIFVDMIVIAEEKQAVGFVSAFVFRATIVEALGSEVVLFSVVLGFNYLHLVCDLFGTLSCIHVLLAVEGLFIFKIPCVGEMNFFICLVLFVMQVIGKVPYVSVFCAADLRYKIAVAGFDILVDESYLIKDKV